MTAELVKVNLTAMTELSTGTTRQIDFTAIRLRVAAAAELLGWSLRTGDDFMATFARELPALALSALFAIPIDDQRQVFTWVELDDRRALESYLRDVHRSETILTGNARIKDALWLAMHTAATCRDDWERMAADPIHVRAVVDEVLSLTPPAADLVRCDGSDSIVDDLTREVVRASLTALSGQLTNVTIARQHRPTMLEVRFERRAET